MKKERKLRVIPIVSEIFDELIKNGKIEINLNNFPKDAIFRDVRQDYARDLILLYYEHASFDDIPIGQIIPIHEITYIK